MVSGLVIALLCRGHVLLEGVPGVAKTLLVRTLAAALAAGVQARAVHPGPDARRRHRLAGLRRPHRRVRVPRGPGVHQPAAGRRDQPHPAEDAGGAAGGDGGTSGQRRRAKPRPLPDPFIVAATQNPIEYEGTYQLPEAQLDRFLLKLNVPLPPRDQEIAILGPARPRLRSARPVGDPAGRRRRPNWPPGATAVREVLVADEVLGYIVDIAGATRHSPSLQLGVSPRGATALLATARSWAWLSGRNYVTPDDVKAMARPTLRHRIALRPEAELEGADPDGVLDGILASVPVPR